MDQDDLLARIQEQGRLYGPQETHRATCTVLTALAELLPAPAYRRLHAALPPDLRRRLPRPGAGRISPVSGCRAFVARVADRLLVDGPNAAFLIRVVLGHLNTTGHGCSPADLATLVPADLRPLLRACPPQAWSPAPLPAGVVMAGSTASVGVAVAGSTASAGVAVAGSTASAGVAVAGPTASAGVAVAGPAGVSAAGPVVSAGAVVAVPTAPAGFPTAGSTASADAGTDAGSGSVISAGDEAVAGATAADATPAATVPPATTSATTVSQMTTPAATVPPAVRAGTDQCRRLPGAAARSRRSPHPPR